MVPCSAVVPEGAIALLADLVLHLEQMRVLFTGLFIRSQFTDYASNTFFFQGNFA
jgi:hypothetical protein